MLIAAIEDNKNAKGTIAMAFIDLTNAFGLVDREFLFQTMEEMRYPPDVIEMLRNMYAGAQIKVGTAYGWTDNIRMDRGLHQGCPLSPLLFTIVMETLIQRLRETGQGYRFSAANHTMAGAAFIDDQVIPTNSGEALQTQLRALESWEKWSRSK